jgi:tetrahydromethanopterin S-methyltransferase subunit C
MNTKNFFAELISRLFSKNPSFFKYIQLAAIVLGIVSKVLDAIKDSGVTLPEWIAPLSSVIVQVSSVVAVIIAQLPNPNPAK